MVLGHLERQAPHKGHIQNLKKGGGGNEPLRLSLYTYLQLHTCDLAGELRLQMIDLAVEFFSNELFLLLRITTGQQL